MNATRKRTFLWLGLVLAAGATTTASAADGPWSVEWDARLRHEQVDEAAFLHDATADTLRLRTGLRLKQAEGWQALVEGEMVGAFGEDYNSGANGRTAYPTVIDPRSIELNQAWVGWKQARFGATLGRQRVMLDNQRFVGNVGWRQNEQTFDALALEATPAKDWTVRYAYLDRVHRVSSDDAIDRLARERDLSTHLLNAAFKHGKQQFVGYGYFHDDRDVVAASTRTLGLRWTGTHPARGMSLGWTLEAAQQHDHGRNPQRFSHPYWLVEPSLATHGITFKAGWERLGSNGRHAFQTPLATLHAFNGWADKFLVTPVNGLDDRYLSAAGNVGPERAGARMGWVVAWHDYQPAHGSGGGYGSEWNASLAVPLRKGLSGMLKYADYQADHFARDTRKLWLQLEWKGSVP